MASYFDAYYAALATSPAFERCGRRVYGDAFRWQLGYATTSAITRASEVLGARPGDTILDLCCGLGGAGAVFQERTGACVIGVDCSGAAALLRRDLRAPAVRGDAGSLPFGGGVFDGIFCFDGFSYETSRLLSECARVLRPGGRLALSISLTPDDAPALEDAVRAAGFLAVSSIDLTIEELPVLRALVSEYQAARRDLRRELGPVFFDALHDEVQDLSHAMARGEMLRLALSADR